VIQGEASIFYHVKELQFNARVSRPDSRFASLLLEQFDGLHGELKNAAESSDLMRLIKGKAEKEQMIHEAMVSPQFLVLSGGGPTLTNSQGVPWSGSYVTANGDLTVDLRSNIAAESRAKIVYEYLMQFTDDPFVKESLSFLMTREVAHFQMFAAALETIQPNFPPGILQGDPRHTHTYFNMSNGTDARGPWNQGQGPWQAGESWQYVDDPLKHVIQTQGEINHGIEGTRKTLEDVERMNRELSRQRSEEIKAARSAAVRTSGRPTRKTGWRARRARKGSKIGWRTQPAAASGRDPRPIPPPPRWRRSATPTRSAAGAGPAPRTGSACARPWASGWPGAGGSAA
jgi:Mn-containing catalase